MSECTEHTCPYHGAANRAKAVVLYTTYCNHMTYRETLETPAEWCDEETVEGSDFCERHLDEE